MSDQEIRLHAMKLAMAYITEHVNSEHDITPLASEIYRFIIGETNE